MAQVPYSPVRDVVPQLAAVGGYQKAETSADMFGAIGGKALEKAGTALEKGASDLNAEVLREQNTINENMAKDALVMAMDETSRAKTEFEALRGKDAQEALPAYQARLQQIQAQATATLPTDVTRRMVQMPLARMQFENRDFFANHARRELDVWTRETNTAVAANAATAGLANMHDPAAVDSYARTVEQATRQRFAGLGKDDATVQAEVNKALGSYWHGIIQVTAATDPNKALGILRTKLSTLDPVTAASLEANLIPRAAQFDGHRIADRAEADLTGAANGNNDRARQAYDYAIRRGHTPEGAAATVANIKHESNFDERAVHDGGAGIGILGWNGDRRKALEAKYGLNPTYEQQLEFYHDELDGKGDAGAGRAGQMIRQPGITAAQAGADLSSVGIRPRDVEGNRRTRGATSEQYLRQYGGTGTATIAPAKPFDPDALRTRILDEIKNIDDPMLRDAAIQRGEFLINRQNHMLAGERHKLDQELPDIQAGLRGGVINAVPADVRARISRLMPADDADRLLRRLDIQQQAGQIYKAIEFGGPEAYREARTLLETGSVSESMRTRIPGVVAIQSDGKTQDLVLRRQLVAELDQQWALQQTRLKEDAAGFAMREPGVNAALLAWRNAQTPEARREAFNDYNTKLLATQELMGVPARDQRILTNAQVGELSNKIATTGPEGGNMVKTLNDLQQQFGSHWQKALGELVTKGKMPGEYQILAGMTDPKQTVASVKLQQGLQLLSEKGGIEAVQKLLPQGSVRQVDDALNSEMSDVVQAMAANGPGGVRFLENLRVSARVMSYYDVLSGVSPAKAAQNAIQGIIRERWDFSGTMMYPKGTGSQVTTGTRAIQTGLDGAMLAAPPITPETAALTPEKRQELWLQSAKRGEWVPNQDASGLTLTVQTFNGARVAVHAADGKPIEYLFATPPTISGRFIPQRAADPRMPAAGSRDPLSVLGGAPTVPAMTE